MAVSSPLRDRSFRAFLGARTVSILGDRIAELVLPLLVLERTGSPLDAGLVGAAYRLPVVLVALWAGAMADRRSPRIVMIASDLGSAALFGLLAVLLAAGQIPLLLLSVLVFLAGVAEVPFVVASGAFLPRIVPEGRLAAANGYVEAADSASTLTGPPLGGLVLQALGIPAAVAANALSFLLSASMLATTRLPEGAVASPSHTGHTSRRPYERAHILAGFHEIIRVPTQWLLQAVGGVLNLYAGVVVLLVVALCRDVLHLSGVAIGLVLAGAGMGGLLSSLLIAPRLQMRRWGSLLGGLLLVMALATSILVVARGGGDAFAANLLLDGAACLAFVVQGTVRQITTPAGILGRVTAASYLFNSAVRVGGIAAAGWCITWAGHRTALGMLALLLALAGIVMLAAPAGRHLSPRE